MSSDLGVIRLDAAAGAAEAGATVAAGATASFGDGDSASAVVVPSFVESVL